MNMTKNTKNDDNNRTNSSAALFSFPHVVNSSDIWENSTTLPSWIKDYFAWHKQERSKVTRKNWKEFKYLWMRCLATDGRCGGTADRIKSVPFILYWAARTKRLLMIYWGRPAPLEEFLVPPPFGGIDWRTPPYVHKLCEGSSYLGSTDIFHRILRRDGEICVASKYQSWSAGSLPYDELAPGPPFSVVFRDIWRTLFTPSPPVAGRIKDALKTLGLKPGAYVAAHLRGLYAIKTRPNHQLEGLAENAIRCATHLRPRGPIYFASDSKYAVDHLRRKYGDNSNSSKRIRVVSLQRSYQPLHVEKTPNWTERHPSEYYDTFVDLYLLGLSRCLTYGAGGYGQWGLWMGYDASCYIQHGNARKPYPCNWTEQNLTVDDDDGNNGVEPLMMFHDIGKKL